MTKPTSDQIQMARDVLGYFATEAGKRGKTSTFNAIERVLGILPDARPEFPLPTLDPELVEKADPDSIIGQMNSMKALADSVSESFPVSIRRKAPAGPHELSDEEKRRCQKITAPGKDH